MLRIFLGVVAIVLIVLVGVALRRPDTFRYEKTGLIDASPDAIYPLVSNLKRGGEWSPYEKKDPAMKKEFAGSGDTVGSTLVFDSNSGAGSGVVQILALVPNERVDLKLTMTKPFRAENHIVYRLTKEGEKTRFAWEMSGENGFLGKLVSIVIDCEKMVTSDFVVGIENLKRLVDAKR